MAKRKARTTAARTKDKAPFLAVLPRRAIKMLKLEAIERGTTASAVLEIALLDWLRSHRDERALPDRKTAAIECRQFLARLDRDTIRKLKRRALQLGRPASTVLLAALIRLIPTAEESTGD